MLELRGIEAGYGRALAVQEVSLAVPDGGIVALLGPNGAGKSTTLKVAVGLLRPRAGSVWLAGERIDGVPADRVLKRGMALVPERRELFPGLTVRENLLLGAHSRSDRPGIAADVELCLTLFPRLAERRAQVVRTLSGGEQQMLAIARGLMARPRMLLLDEPSLGIAPLLVEEIFRRLPEIRARGTAILLVEQNAEAALAVADHGYVIEAGRIRLSGTPAELRADDAVRRAYLG